jgi:predicted metal-dependent phosphotriesterase family hydrolase
MTGQEVMTVRGPIAADQLGFVQPHEHLLLNVEWIETRWSLDGILDDEALAVEELSAYRAAGGQSIFDLTNAGLRRNPEAVRRISEATGVHVVMGCGWYRQPFYPPEELIDRTSTQALADRLLDEIANGLDGTGVRPGIIGEIGSNKDFVSAQEERVFRAAGRAAARSGLAVTTHSVASPVGLEHLRILCEERVDPARIAIGHSELPQPRVPRGDPAPGRVRPVRQHRLQAARGRVARSSAHQGDRGAAAARLGASTTAQPGRVPPLSPQGVRGQRIRLSDPLLSTEAACGRRRR